MVHVLECRIRNLAIAITILVSIAWVLLTSSSFIFPVIDFGGKYLAKGGWTPDDIYTNSRPIKLLMETACLVIRPCQSEIKLLKDEPESFPLTPGWVLWSPVRDSDYPHTRNILGYNAGRGYGLYPSFNLPREWGVVSSSQSMVSIIRIGSWWSPKLHPVDFGTVRLDGVRLENGILKTEAGMVSPRVTKSIWLIPNVSRSFEFISSRENGVPVDELFIDLKFMIGGSARLTVTVESTHGEKQSETIEVESEGGREKVYLALASTLVKKVTLTMLSDVSANSSIYFRDRLFPSVSNKIRISESGEGRSTAHLAVDKRHNTAWIAQKPGSAVLELDMGQIREEALIMYRLSGVQLRDYDGVQPDSWRLEGLAEDGRWALLDERRDAALPGGPGEFKSMYVRKPGVYSRYRLIIHPKEGLHEGRLGLSEIELYTNRVSLDESAKPNGG